MKVKPAPGLKVRDPVSRAFLPDAGREVPESSFWFRRLACGDVLLVPPENVVTPNDEAQK